MHKRLFTLHTMSFFGAALALFIATASLLIMTSRAVRAVRATTADKQVAAQPARLNVTILTVDSCQTCASVNGVLDIVAQQPNIEIVGTDKVDITSPAGQTLIKLYNIERTPTIIMTGELAKFPELEALWKSLGTRTDDAFVLRPRVGPYFEIATNKVRGQVSVTFLTDPSCTTCYSVRTHEQILARFGVPLTNAQTYETRSVEGQKFIKRYGIRYVPTFIIEGDISAYEDLGKIWSTVGTTENDVAFVFRQGIDQMGTYLDLRTGNTITPAAPTSTAPTR